MSKFQKGPRKEILVPWNIQRSLYIEGNFPVLGNVLLSGFFIFSPLAVYFSLCPFFVFIWRKCNQLGCASRFFQPTNLLENWGLQCVFSTAVSASVNLNLYINIKMKQTNKQTKTTFFQTNRKQNRIIIEVTIWYICSFQFNHTLTPGWTSLLD